MMGIEHIINSKKRTRDMNLLKSTLIISVCMVCACWIVTIVTCEPINAWSFFCGWWGAVISGFLKELIVPSE